MGIAERQARERLLRARLITSRARRIAESEGWDAVTTRRLASEVEYSQPVIYKHFASMELLAEAVALEGFDELGLALGAARSSAAKGAEVSEVAHAYLAYAADHPALYDVMFNRPTGLRFGESDPATPLANAWTEMRAAMATVTGDHDAETLTEVLWAALHGLVMLGRNNRLRSSHQVARLNMLLGLVAAAIHGVPCTS